MKSVGIIVNPAAGKDLRRLVAFGSTATHSEKVNAVVRILRALDALGVERVRIAPDPTNLGQRAIEATGDELVSIDAACLELPWLLGSRSDTERAATLMREQDFGCILVLGGDGTSRAVASHCGDVPLIPISTGTNNAFPRMLEGTLAGMAAACVVRALHGEEALVQAPMLRLLADGEEVSHALVDIALIDTLDSGALAVWEGHSIRELFLAQARPDSIGLSAIGGCLAPLEPGCGEGTESLCLPDADLRFRRFSQEFKNAPRPACVILATDGYKKSFPTDEGFFKVGEHVLSALRGSGEQSVRRALPGWLESTSRDGSGDDISVGILYRQDPVSGEPWHE